MEKPDAADSLIRIQASETTPSTKLSSSSCAPLLFSAGLVADIQYAPIPDGHSFSGTPRYYRHALDAARIAAQHFQQERVPLVLNLGDLVDGKCQETGADHDDDDDDDGGDDDDVVVSPDNGNNNDPGHVAVDQVLDALSAYQHGPVLHAYGNHCLYNLNRHELQSKLNIKFQQEPCGDLVGYSAHDVEVTTLGGGDKEEEEEGGGSTHRIRLIVLDSYDVAKMQRCEQSSSKYRAADEILRQNNPNHATNENSPEGLQGLDRRFVAFNGAIGPIQLDWLQKQLAQVRAEQSTAIILSHQPILPQSSNPICLMWNYEQVLEILREYSDVIMASFAGHAHKGGYQRDEASGIHFRVIEGMLESCIPTYCLLDVYPDRLVVRGVGDCESAEYTMEHLSSHHNQYASWVSQDDAEATATHSTLEETSNQPV